MIARNLVKSLAVSYVLALSFQSSAQGQSIPSAYEFLETRQEAGPFVGTLNLGTGRFEFGPGSGVYYGARYGIRIGGPFGLEGVVGYFPTSRDLVDPGRVEGDRVVGEVDANILTLDARLRFNLTGDRTWHGLSPFLFTGGGIAMDTAEETEAEAILLANDRFEFKNSFLGMIGGGISWYATGRLIIRGDAGLSLWRLATPTGYQDPERGFAKVGEKEWVSGPALTLGIAYRF